MHGAGKGGFAGTFANLAGYLGEIIRFVRSQSGAPRRNGFGPILRAGSRFAVAPTLRLGDGHAFAGVSCDWVYRIGHTGAKAVRVEKIQRESGDPTGDTGGTGN